MRKTHGKKQTRKNKTKRRAIRGGGIGKGFAQRFVFGNPRPGSNSQGSSYLNGERLKTSNQSTNTTPSVSTQDKAHKADTSIVSKPKSERPVTRSQTRSIAQAPPQ